MPPRRGYPAENHWIAQDVVNELQRLGYDAEVVERGRGSEHEILVVTNAPSEVFDEAFDDAELAFME